MAENAGEGSAEPSGDAAVQAAGPPAGRRVALGVLTAAVYLLAACLAYWPVAPFSGSRMVGIVCACSDHAQEVWFLSWVSFAALHGHNPLFSSFLIVPQGVNLGINTSMP